MQREITHRQDLLDEKGRIIEEGWARRPFWRYDRKKIRSGALRIKEWDYYAIMSHEHQICLTVTCSDLGFAGLFAIALIDMKKKEVSQVDTIKPLTLGKLGLPNHSGDHNIAFSNKTLRIAYSRREERRRILFAAPDILLPDGRRGIDVDLTLVQPPQLESLNIATSWEKKRTAFYLNEKINCLAASGTVRFGNDSIALQPHEAFGVLDWGRGRWTYTNHWYWASASGRLEDCNFGLNLGYGFTDRSPASENAIIFDNHIHKLEEVTFHIPENDYLKKWTITSSDGRCELEFTPAADRQSHINLLLVKSVQHQVFGTFSGTVVLDDGTSLQVDSLPGFAEDVYNRY
jgi:hypothetical protein